MAGSTVKIGVDVTQFKQGMQQAQNSAKTLNAQMKANEAQFKATGDKEQYMANQSKLLKQQLEAQKTAVANAEKALKAMRDNGIEETSAAYQQMERSLAGAQAQMYSTQAAMNSLTTSEQRASGGASELNGSLNSINKQVSLDNVIKGIDSITGALESAAQKAVSVGKSIWDEIKKTAAWADDTATLAEMYEIPLDRYLRMQKLVDNGLDTSVDSMLTAMDKMGTAVGKESNAANEALRSLGLMTTYTTKYGETVEELSETDPEKLFWKVGQAIKDMPKGFDKNAAAMALFGKSWREMLPLFNSYRSVEEYEEALAGVTVNSEDAVNEMAELNNRLNELESAWNSTKLELLKALAPALEDAATALSGLLNRITEYLKTDEGQAKLKKMEEAVSALFDDLKNIDPEKVVENFVAVFDKVVDAFTWVKDHWDDVKNGIEGIAGAFVGLKLTSAGLKVLQLINGLKGIGGTAGVNSAVDALNGRTPVTTPTTPVTTPRTTTPVTTPRTTAPTTPPVGGTGGMGFWGWAQAGLNMAATALVAYEVSFGDAARSMQAWADEAKQRQAELDAQEQSFTRQSDPELVAAWKYVNEHANDDNFLEDLGRRYYKFDKSADVTSEYYDYEDPFWDPLFYAYNRGQITDDTWDSLTEMMGKIVRKQKMQEQGWTGGWETLDLMEVMNLLDQLEKELAEAANNPPEVPVQPTVDDQAKTNLQEQIGMVQVPANVVLTNGGDVPGLANGLFSVPWDGFPAILHKGERVVPASEASRYTYNNYFGNVNLNNGLEVDALTESIERRNRRQRSGFGAA